MVANFLHLRVDLLQKVNLILLPMRTGGGLRLEGEGVLITEEAFFFGGEEGDNFLELMFGLNEVIYTRALTSNRAASA